MHYVSFCEYYVVDQGLSKPVCNECIEHTGVISSINIQIKIKVKD